MLRVPLPLPRKRPDRASNLEDSPALRSSQKRHFNMSIVSNDQELHGGNRPGSARRWIARTGVLTLVVAQFALVPRPGLAAENDLEPGVRTDSSVPELSPVPLTQAPPPAPPGQSVDAGLTATPESVTPSEAPDTATADSQVGGDVRLVGGAEDIADFVLIGVAFRSTSRDPAQVRVRTDGRWTAWTQLIDTTDHEPDPETTERRRAINGLRITDPVWIDHADAYQIDLPGDSSAPRIFLVREADGVESARGPMAVPELGTARPAIRLRAAWGARAYRGSPQISRPLRTAFVHHTVNSNSYNRSQVPGILRAIQAYHQDARGWSDIGYNFLIDRFGEIWEGRAGGIDNPVVGAHASGQNRGSVGIAFIGEATDSVQRNAIDAFGRLIGWKMSISGIQPSRSNVLGHRDVGSTACPGDALYASLGQIVRGAQASQRPTIRRATFGGAPISVDGHFVPLSGDFNGDGYSDIVWYAVGDGDSHLWFGSPWGFVDKSFTVSALYRPVAGDFDGDGLSDIFWYGPDALLDAVWYGEPNGSFSVSFFSIAGDFEPVVGDYDGSGMDDILWYDAGLDPDYLWWADAGRAFEGSSITVNGSYQPFAGDFDGDRQSDIFWYGPGRSRDILWFGKTNRHFSSRSAQINAVYKPVVGDFLGRGTDDILWYGVGEKRDVLYIGRASRTFRGQSLDMQGVYDDAFAGDWDADGLEDVFWYRAEGPDLLWFSGR